MSVAVSASEVSQAQNRRNMHTLLDLHGNIPTFIRVTSGDVHDVNLLDEILPDTTVRLKVKQNQLVAGIV